MPELRQDKSLKSYRSIEAKKMQALRSVCESLYHLVQEKFDDPFECVPTVA